MKKTLFIFLLILILSLCIACSTNNDDGELYEKAINKSDISLNYTIDQDKNNVLTEINTKNAIQNFRCILKLYNNNDPSQCEFIIYNYNYMGINNQYFKYYNFKNLNNVYDRLTIDSITGLKQNNSKDFEESNIRGIVKAPKEKIPNSNFTVWFDDSTKTLTSYGSAYIKCKESIIDSDILLRLIMQDNTSKLYEYEFSKTFEENEIFEINLNKSSSDTEQIKDIVPYIITARNSDDKYIIENTEVDYYTYLHGSINSSNNSSNDIVGGISGPVKQPTFKEEFNQFKEEHSDIYYSVVASLITITVIIILIIIYKFIKSKKANNKNRSLNEQK